MRKQVFAWRAVGAGAVQSVQSIINIKAFRNCLLYGFLQIPSLYFITSGADIKYLFFNFVNLEMQVLNYHNWEERSLSYLARCYDNLKEGEDYSQVKTSIHIGFVDFTPKPDHAKFFSKYRMQEIDTNYQFSGKFELSVVEFVHSFQCDL